MNAKDLKLGQQFKNDRTTYTFVRTTENGNLVFSDARNEDPSEEITTTVDIFESLIKSGELKEVKLSDFVDEAGDVEIWYEVNGRYEEWDLRIKLIDQLGADYTDRHYPNGLGVLITDPRNLEKTHVLLGTIKETDLNEIFHKLNNWGGTKEVRSFIKNKGLTHTSMSIGDVIKIGDRVMFVDGIGFKDLTQETN